MTHNLLPFMHTEDDTFNALRRIPFQQMRALAVRAKIALTMGISEVDVDAMFKKNGWTREDYEAEVRKANALASDFGNRRQSFEGAVMKPHNPYKVHHG